ncbi:LOW QUALITY PROTEIN: uncharacterized protein ACRADG_007515 [Cochliomyia hominivorax]
MATATAPNIPAWIKADLFEPVYREIFPDFKGIKNFNVVPALSAGENYATVMLRLEAEIRLEDETTKSISLMLKTAHDTEAFREMMKNQPNSLFDMETLVYRTVIPDFEKLYNESGAEIRFAPKFYEIDTDQPYLLLEDLKPKGFKMFNRLEGFDVKHTKAVLTILAKWHAASAVLYPTKDKCPEIFLTNFFTEENRSMVEKVFDGIYKAFLKCAKSYEGQELYYENLYRHTDSIIDDMFEVNRLDENGFNVLNHGDCSNNIMFQYDDFGNMIDLHLVDYQIVHYGSPAQDLYYILLSSTHYDVKLKKFDYFIKYYHDCLTENLKLLRYPKKIPTLRDLHIMLHKHNAWAFNSSTGVMAAVLLDPSDNAKLDNYLTDSAEAVEFKMQLYSNPRYRKHMEKLLPWLHYRGVF